MGELTEATILDDVDKAIINRFRQAGPSLIKQEQRESVNREVHGVLLVYSESPFPPGLEVSHLQYVTSAYFDDPQTVLCHGNQRKRDLC